MIRLLIRLAMALVFWIIGFKTLSSFWVPIVTKYALADSVIGWIFGAYAIWATAWVTVVCVLSYHITLKTLSCIWYSHDMCRNSK